MPANFIYFVLANIIYFVLANIIYFVLATVIYFVSTNIIYLLAGHSALICLPAHSLMVPSPHPAESEKFWKNKYLC